MLQQSAKQKLDRIFVTMKILIFIFCFVALTHGTAENITSTNLQAEESFVFKIANLYQMARAAIDDNLMSRRAENIPLPLQEIANVTYNSENFTLFINNIAVWQVNPINVTFTCNSSQESNFAIQHYNKPFKNIYFDLQIKSWDTSEITNLSFASIPTKSYSKPSKKQREIISLAMRKSKQPLMFFLQFSNLFNKEFELDNALNEHYIKLAKNTCSQMTKENILQGIIHTKFKDTPVEIEISDKTVDFEFLIDWQSYHTYNITIHNAQIRGKYRKKDFQYLVDRIIIRLQEQKEARLFYTKISLSHDIDDKEHVFGAAKVTFVVSYQDDDFVRREILSTIEEELTKELEDEVKKIIN